MHSGASAMAAPQVAARRWAGTRFRAPAAAEAPAAIGGTAPRGGTVKGVGVSVGEQAMVGGRGQPPTGGVGRGPRSVRPLSLAPRGEGDGETGGGWPRSRGPPPGNKAKLVPENTICGTHDRHDGPCGAPCGAGGGSGHTLTIRAGPQPKEITDIRDFLQKARREDAKRIKVKKSNDATKFKIRCSRYLYTLRVADKQKAEKLISSLPPGARRPQPQCTPFAPRSRRGRRPPAPQTALTRRNPPFRPQARGGLSSRSPWAPHARLARALRQ